MSYRELCHVPSIFGVWIVRLGASRYFLLRYMVCRRTIPGGRGGYVMVLLLGGLLNVRCEEVLHGAVLLFVVVIVCGRWSGKYRLYTRIFGKRTTDRPAVACRIAGETCRLDVPRAVAR